MNAYDMLRSNPKKEKDYFADTIHPNKKGHELVGKKAYKILA